MCTCGWCKECTDRKIAELQSTECTCTFREDWIELRDDVTGEVVVDPDTGEPIMVPKQVIDVKCNRCIDLERLQSITCFCGECRECIYRKIEVQQAIECICIYETVKEPQPSYDEQGNEIMIEVDVERLVTQCERCKEIDRLSKILEAYAAYEKAFIPEEQWSSCKYENGIIYTPNNEMPTQSPIEELQESQMGQDMIIDDLIFEVIPTLEVQINMNNTEPVQLASVFSNKLLKIQGGNGMAAYLAKKIMDGRDYEVVFRTYSYKQYQDEVDTILELEGRGDLIVK